MSLMLTLEEKHCPWSPRGTVVKLQELYRVGNGAGETQNNGNT